MKTTRISLAIAATSLCLPVYAQTVEERLSALEEKYDSVDAFSSLEIGGRVQVDYNQYDGAYNADNDGATGNDLFARRIRAYVESEQDKWDHKLLLEFAEGTAEIVMVRVRYSSDSGQKFQIGKLREDISLQALTSSKHVSLLERSSLADMFSPYFRWGASTYRQFPESGFRYAVGVYKNDAFGASGDDEDGQMSWATSGRVNWSSEFDSNLIHLGGWASYRQMGGDELGAQLARGEVREVSVRLVDYAAGGDTVALDSMDQYGFEAAWQNNSLLLQSEYATRTLDTEDSTSALDGESFDSWYVQASWFPGGETKVYKPGTAVFVSPSGIANAWEFAARYSDTDATSDNQGTQVKTLSLGVNYHLNENIRFMFTATDSEVSGPGTDALVGTHDSGKGFATRFQYLF